MRAGLGALVVAMIAAGLVAACGAAPTPQIVYVTPAPSAAAVATSSPRPSATASPSSAPAGSPSPTPTVPTDSATPTTKPLPAAYPGPLGPRAVFTYYFYWYDYVTGAHLNAHGPAIDPQTDQPVQDPPVTWRGTAWHARQLMDMAYAGIDVVMPNYWGDTEQELWPRRGIVTLAQALERVRLAGTTPPAVAMFYDTESLRGRDLRTKAARDAIYDDVRFFFRTIPRPYWALTEGSRPIIWFYYAAPLAGYDSRFLADLATRFARDFGPRPYIVLEADWPGGVPTLKGYDATNYWVGPKTPAWTDTIASVVPGYDEHWIAGRKPPWRILPREGGAVYRRSLAAATECGVPWLVIETWNEFHEATDIAETVEYGRLYLDITREYAAWFKAGGLPAGVRIETPYTDSPSVSVVLGASDVSRGLTLAPSEAGIGGLHVPVEEAGQAGRRTVFRPPGSPPEAYLYFRVDDGFYFNRPQDVRIDVTYFDQGTEPIYLQYDADPCASNLGAGTTFKRTTLAYRADTKAWKTASIVLRDATFTGAEMWNDFRLVTQGGQPLTVGSVTVTKLP